MLNCGMRLYSAKGAQNIERQGATHAGVAPDWESVRVFLEVARSSSFRTAAVRLKMTGHGVAHRVAQLERQLGVLLFTRHRDGVRLTADGQHLLTFAEQMEEASRGFIRGRGTVSQPFRGEVRIAATEGLGTFWLTPQLIEFVRAHPQILIDLHCSMQRPDELIVRAQADIAIQIEQPAPRDLIVRRIGRMHIMPCASASYLKTYGVPKTKAELIQKHRIVMMYADQGRGTEVYNELFPEHPQTGFMAIRTDVSTALYAAVVNGLAIGWLPTYYFSLGAPVVPIDIGCIFHFDIWLSYHPDLGGLPRVRRMIDWTVEAFNAQKNPWFRDEFIHPTELEKYLKCNSPATIDAVFGRPDNSR
jgi:DNA-binding transcriptional LysR family regulator